MRRRFVSALLCAALFFAPVASSQLNHFGYIPFASDYDGTNDYLLRGAELTGVIDGKEAIFSAWIRIDGGDGANLEIIRSTGNRSLHVHRTVGNKLRFTSQNSSPELIWTWFTANTYLASSAWIHILASLDLGGAFEEVYINDVPDGSSTVFTDDTIDYTDVDLAIGANVAGGDKFNGAIAEIYVNYAESLDITLESNRRLFIDANGDPVYLGLDGAIPTGTAPAIYLRNRFNGFGVNAGTGGDFAHIGAVTDTAGPVDAIPPLLMLPGRAGHIRTAGRGGRGGLAR